MLEEPSYNGGNEWGYIWPMSLIFDKPDLDREDAEKMENICLWSSWSQLIMGCWTQWSFSLLQQR